MQFSLRFVIAVTIGLALGLAFANYVTPFQAFPYGQPIAIATSLAAAALGVGMIQLFHWWRRPKR